LSHYHHHPAQGLFLLMGLSLGVAILLGTLIVSRAAETSFTSAQQTVGGQVAALIRPINGQNTLPQSTYVTLRRNGYTQIIPQVEGRVRLSHDRFAVIQGIDAFSLMHLGSSQNTNNKHDNGFNLLAFSFPPYQLLVSKTQAQLLGVTDGDILTLKDGNQLPVIKVMPDSFGIGYNLMCDLQCGQQVLGKTNQLTAITLTSKPPDEEQLKSLLGPDMALLYPRKNAQNTALSEAFFLNITAVSFLAFLVGCFIAFNAVRFCVLQRMDMVKQLRMTGVTFSEVALGLLLELLSWAFMASLIGCLLGWVIAGSLLPSVGITLNQLFQGKNLLAIDDIGQWWSLALLIALVATTIATVQPFWQLAKQRPLQSNNTTQSPNRIGYLGLAFVVGGSVMTLLPHSQVLGFTITACWFIGGALLVPALLALLYNLLAKNRWLAQRPKLQWVVSDGKFNHARLSVAMMAFTVAIAAGISVTTMVSSFRIALEDYLTQTLSEDLYLRPDNDQTLNVKQFLDQHNDVNLAYRFYLFAGRIEVKDQALSSIVRGITNHTLRHNSISLEKQTIDVWQKLHQRKGVIINQTLALQQQLKLGDTFKVRGKSATVEVEVLGIYFSYGATYSAFILNQQWLKSLWPAVNTAEVGVFAHSDIAMDKLILTLKEKFNLNSHQIIKPQEMRVLALRIFDQTFKVTQLLIVFTLIIAAIGIYCACYAAQMDKQRQLTLLKVLGINHREIVGLSLLQLCFNTLVACLVALPLGLIIAWASVHIVLQYSFGWHFAIITQPVMLGGIIATAIAIALLAGVIPLYQLSKKTVINAFRESV
jgi:putative ABC transport system permease protein